MEADKKLDFSDKYRFAGYDSRIIRDQRKKYLYWGFFVLYIIGTLLLTTIIDIDLIPMEYQSLRSRAGELAHFCLLGGFAWLILLGLNLKKGKVIHWQKSSYRAAFFYAFFFGVFIELLQTFTSTRTASIRDVVFNTLGIIFVLIIIKRKQPDPNYSG